MGDSIIKWAGQGQYQLQGGGETVWQGVGGARLVDVKTRVQHHLRRNPRPTTLILHLGTNDIFAEPWGTVRRRMNEILHDLRNMLPGVRIIWSDVLPRLFYYGESSRGAGNRFRVKLNRYAHHVCLQLHDMHVIRHDELFPAYSYGLFRRDGLHLSERGIGTFIQNLENGLLFFNQFPNTFMFPPDFQG